MHKSRHQILTIKSVHYSAMARNGVRKILQEKNRVARFPKTTCYKIPICQCLLGIMDAKENALLLDFPT